MPTNMLAADTKKGAVVKANAQKASTKAATAKTANESSKKANAATDVLPQATKKVSAREKSRATRGGEHAREITFRTRSKDLQGES